MALQYREQGKTLTELEAECERMKQRLQEKENELHKVRSSINSLKN